MRSAAEDMDCNLLEETYEEMKGLAIPEEDKELFDQIGKALKNFDYDGIATLLKKSV